MRLFQKKPSDADQRAADLLLEQVATVRAVASHYAPGHQAALRCPDAVTSLGAGPSGAPIFLVPAEAQWGEPSAVEAAPAEPPPTWALQPRTSRVPETRLPAPIAPAPIAPTADGVLRVLVIEDNPFDLAVLEDLVEAIEPRSIELLPVATRGEGERVAGRTAHDLVLLDLDLPDSIGIQTLIDWQEHGASSAPVIILSGSGEPAIVDRARALGVVHFIHKDQLAGLADEGVTGSRKLARLLRSTVTRAAAASST